MRLRGRATRSPFVEIASASSRPSSLSLRSSYAGHHASPFRPRVAVPRVARRAKRGGPGSHHMKLLFLRDFLVLSRCWFNGYQQKYQQRCQGEEDRSAAPMRSRQPRALVVYRGRSNYEGSLIASSRESVFEVGPARAGRLSVPRRALASRSLKNGW